MIIEYLYTVDQEVYITNSSMGTVKKCKVLQCSVDVNELENKINYVLIMDDKTTTIKSEEQVFPDASSALINLHGPI